MVPLTELAQQMLTDTRTKENFQNALVSLANKGARGFTTQSVDDGNVSETSHKRKASVLTEQDYKDTFGEVAKARSTRKIPVRYVPDLNKPHERVKVACG